MGWGELVRRDLTSEVRKTPEALLSDEIKNQLLNFSESKLFWPVKTMVQRYILLMAFISWCLMGLNCSICDF